MKRYLYLWIENQTLIDETDPEKGYLLSNFGINLSSKYNISHTFIQEKLSFTINQNPSYEEGFFSDSIIDLKAIVGNNGSGKTTILLRIYQLIAEGINNKIGNYALVYQNEGEERIHIASNYHNIEEKKDYVLHDLEDAKSSFVVRYSAIPNDRELQFDNVRIEGDYHGTRDISTDALYILDKESLDNHATSVNYPNQLDYLHCFYIKEQDRKISFLIDVAKNGLDDFWKDFSIPKIIKISPTKVNISNAFAEIADYSVKNNIFNEVITKFFLQKEFLGKWEKYKKSDELCSDIMDEADLNSLKDIIINKCDSYYNHLSIPDKFRFSAILSNFRTFHNNPSHPAFTEITLANLPQHTADINEEILKDHPIWNHLAGLNIQTEEIINILPFNSPLNYNSPDQKKNEPSVFINFNNEVSLLKRIFDLHKEIFKLTPFISFEFTRPLSSGEDAFLKFYSRLYDAISKQVNGKHESNIHLLLDEIDVFLHPEWQRQWLTRFVRGIKYIEQTVNAEGIINKPLKIQIIMSTHSPFMLTDFLTENISLLQRKDISKGTSIVNYENIDSSNNIFGSNIYDLVSSGFFLENTIGYFAEEKIKKLLQSPFDTGHFKKIYSKIGDPVLKVLIDSTLREKVKNDKN